MYCISRGVLPITQETNEVSSIIVQFIRTISIIKTYPNLIARNLTLEEKLRSIISLRIAMLDIMAIIMTTRLPIGLKRGKIFIYSALGSSIFESGKRVEYIGVLKGF